MFQFKVEDMSCEHCLKAITEAILALDPTSQVVVDLNAKLVKVEGPLEQASVVNAIEAAGYTPRAA